MKTRTQRAAGSAQIEKRPTSLPARRALRAVPFFIALLLIVVPLFAQTANVKVPDADTLVGAPKGQPLAGDDLTRTTQEIAATIRCPVCQGLAIADSPAEMAQNMKAQVRELLSRGYTRDQILSYFERSYGQFVLLQPKFQGVTSLVWTLPIFALLLGVVIVFMKMKSLERPPAAVEEVESDPYIARVRELVKGDQQ